MTELVDLHVHSKASDGTLSPSELVIYAKNKGLSAIALTDHDTVDGIDEAFMESKKQDFEVIPGIEISTEYDEREMHILGLNIDHKSPYLLNNIKRLKEDRDERNPKIIEKLNELGFQITLDEAKSHSNGKIIGRLHIAAAMAQKGYVESISEAFEKYLKGGAIAYVKRRKLAPEEAINIITQSNGVPILAHPGLLNRPPQEIERIILKLKEKGLLGVEVFHSDHSKEAISLLKTLVKRHNLLVSGGSDFHGEHKGGLDIGLGYGNVRVEYKVLEAIKALKK